MIHEEICTYEVCKLAKEKGFPVKEIECWYCEYDGRPTKEIVDEQQYPIINQSLLQRWLREEKGLCISVEAYPTLAIMGKVCFAWVIKSGSDGHFMESNDSLQVFSTYELALEDALKYALENLV